MFGTAAGFDASLDLAALDGANGFRVDGVNPDYIGSSVAGAGDVNGDGFDDLIVGAPTANGTYGASYVVFGTAAGFGPSLDLASLDGTNGFRLDGVSPDYFGTSVSGAGDVNGDGIDDLIIGARNERDDVGAGYVVFGSSAGFGAGLDLAALDGTNGFRVDGIVSGDYGVAVAGAGDINGDGVGDLIMGIYADNSLTGRVESYVVFGSKMGFEAVVDLAAIDAESGFRIEGNASRLSYFHRVAVAGAGDVNGDGVDDLAVGAPNTSESYVVFGSRQLGGATMPIGGR